jgi:phage gp16-like protein
LAKDDRSRDLAKIHVAKKQLGLDDGTYRAMLWTIGRVHSAADLDFEGRARVLEHLRQSGFVDYGRRSAPAPDKRRLLSKIEAMMYASGRPLRYAEGMAERMYKVRKLDWCSAEQLRGIVAALEKDRQRRLAKPVPVPETA